MGLAFEAPGSKKAGLLPSRAHPKGRGQILIWVDIICPLGRLPASPFQLNARRDWKLAHGLAKGHDFTSRARPSLAKPFSAAGAFSGLTLRVPRTQARAIVKQFFVCMS